jgi:hypothetical protein
LPDYIITEHGLILNTQEVSDSDDVGIALQGENAYYVDADDVSWPVACVSMTDSGWSSGPVAEA